MTLGGPDVTIFKVRVKSRVRVIKSSTQYQPLNPELDYVEYTELNSNSLWLTDDNEWIGNFPIHQRLISC